MRTRPCSEGITSGRLRKARAFLQAAESLDSQLDQNFDLGDAFVTLCVHAGIAACDVVCCRHMGVHSQGERHQDAVGLVRRVQPDGPRLAGDLSVLLGMKTAAGYGAQAMTHDQRRRAVRSARRLVHAADHA